LPSQWHALIAAIRHLISLYEARSASDDGRLVPLRAMRLAMHASAGRWLSGEFWLLN